MSHPASPSSQQGDVPGRCELRAGQLVLPEQPGSWLPVSAARPCHALPAFSPLTSSPSPPPCPGGWQGPQWSLTWSLSEPCCDLWGSWELQLNRQRQVKGVCNYEPDLSLPGWSTRDQGGAKLSWRVAVRSTPLCSLHQSLMKVTQLWSAKCGGGGVDGVTCHVCV